MKLALIITGAVLLAVYLLPIFDGVHNAGTFFGSVFGAAVVALGIGFDKFTQKERGVILLLLAIIILVTALLMYTVYHRGKSVRSDAKIIVVLGCRVRGLEPSKALCKRVDKAFTLLSSSLDSVAILSGGQGSDELISEAECMRRMLSERGIPDSRLILESHSTSTDENLRFTTQILKEREMSNKIYLVTSDYHQMRALMLCKRYGLDASPQSSKTKPLHLPTFLLREILGLVKDYIK